jgi:two-component system, NtrC family, C4-dicarboxylate transport response regulator DctD
MSDMPRVALVDDDVELRASTIQLLTLAGYGVLPFPAGEPALAAIGAEFDGVVVTDVRMPGMSGIELFRALHARDPELPVILVTGHGDIDMAVDTIKSGAWDFLSKPFTPDALLAAIGRATAARALVIENRRLRATADTELAGELVGESPVIRNLRGVLPVLAEADLDVVIQGATGTGKRHVARLIHRMGRRARHRFVGVDCAAIPDAVIERELFARGGIIAQAHRGTLFLDNLDHADERLQHRLARFAEARAVALEARDPDPVDARILAAIGEDGRERMPPTLYHRLAGASLRLPALAERIEDIPLLVAHFATDAASRHRCPVPPLVDAAHLFAQRDWPGNARELEMAVERLVLGLDTVAASETGDASLPDRLKAFERAAITDAVQRADGEVATAIRILGIPRETFYYRVKRLGLDLKQLRGG